MLTYLALVIDPHDRTILRLHVRRIPLRLINREFLSVYRLESHWPVAIALLFLSTLTIQQYTGESPVNTPWLGLKRLVHPSREGVQKAFWGEEMMEKRREKHEQSGKSGVDRKV